MPKHKPTQPAYPHEIDGVGIIRSVGVPADETPADEQRSVGVPADKTPADEQRSVGVPADETQED